MLSWPQRRKQLWMELGLLKGTKIIYLCQIQIYSYPIALSGWLHKTWGKYSVCFKLWFFLLILLVNICLEKQTVFSNKYSNHFSKSYFYKTSYKKKRIFTICNKVKSYLSRSNDLLGTTVKNTQKERQGETKEEKKKKKANCLCGCESKDHGILENGNTWLQFWVSWSNHTPHLFFPTECD